MRYADKPIDVALAQFGEDMYKKCRLAKRDEWVTEQAHAIGLGGESQRNSHGEGDGEEGQAATRARLATMLGHRKRRSGPGDESSFSKFLSLARGTAEGALGAGAGRRVRCGQVARRL